MPTYRQLNSQITTIVVLLAVVEILRSAFSSIPDMPSRRSSSAMTSAGTQIEMRQHHEAMKPQVALLRRPAPWRAAVARVFGGQHDFSGFLADLLQNRVVTLVKQARHVGSFRIAALAAIDDRREAQQRVVGSSGLRDYVYDMFGVFQHGIDGDPVAGFHRSLEFLEKARMAARMARNARHLLDLQQHDVFVAASFSIWVEFEENPGVEALSNRLASAGFDVRPDEPPTNVGIAGQSGLSIGGITVDPNQARACWLWMVADNLRLTAENALAVAKEYTS